jgi:hypothetical protein
VVAAPDEFQPRPADVAGAGSPAGGKGARLMTLIRCAGRGRVTLTSAPLAGGHGPLACRVVLRPGSHHDAGAASGEAFGLACVQPDGERPGDKADSWSIYVGLGPRLYGPLATPSRPARSVESSAERTAPRARSVPAVTRLPILMPAPRCSGPWRRFPHVKYRRGGTVTSLTSRCLPPILAEIPFPGAHRPDIDWQEAAICRQADPELSSRSGQPAQPSQRSSGPRRSVPAAPCGGPAWLTPWPPARNSGSGAAAMRTSGDCCTGNGGNPASLPAPNPHSRSHSPEPGGR